MPTSDLVKLRGWRKVVQVVRNWLNKKGAKKLAARLDKWLSAGLIEQEKADLFVADLVNAARECCHHHERAQSASNANGAGAEESRCR